jgi:hypothetical protein
MGIDRRNDATPLSGWRFRSSAIVFFASFRREKNRVGTGIFNAFLLARRSLTD